ncbi:MAG: flippase-like domain-containing protein [Methanobrevibacter sp.]|nr:flippase-like domain-containing protein [Methanobrevibacter sp.]
MKKNYFLLIGLILIVLVILWLNPIEIIKDLQEANVYYILLACLIHLFIICLRALRWGFIINQTYKIKNNFIVKTISLFAGNFTPMKAGGEVLSGMAGAEINKISLSKGLSAAITERFFDLVVTSCLLLVSTFFTPQPFTLIPLIGGILNTIVVLFIFLLNWREETGLWFLDKIQKLLLKLRFNSKKVDSINENFQNGLKNMVSHSISFINFKNFIILLVVSLISWLFECFRLYILFKAFNFELSFVVIIVLYLLSNMIGVISLIPGGIGSIELSQIALFSLFNVPKTLAGTIALTDRFITFGIVNILGIIFSAMYAKDILKEVKKMF